MILSNEDAARRLEFSRFGCPFATLRTEGSVAYPAGSAAPSVHADSIFVRRIGRNTNQASSAAIAFMMLAVMKTACQLPVIAVSTLDKGARSEAVPLAV